MSLLIGIVIYLYVGVGSWLQQITSCSPTRQVREVVGAAKHQLLNRSIAPKIYGDIRFILEITQNDTLELHKSSTWRSEEKKIEKSLIHLVL